ncbi:tigger transposable element-derived protein 1-like [Teleopsis dalmanni]|uniref:tigger transposable element-derived protein 1-like n=1 Tax=Teleopsis dalmanni TaxID=139649 RepID=UPI0018CCA3B7|nr:tigger transposable element-derived protein 1-like [Teleopsis dalmanni]
MPPNTTSILQPMVQGVMSNFKCYYLRRAFNQLLNATDGHNKPSMKELWKNYSILMAIENIDQSWKEVKKTCMNGMWGQIWPECIQINMPEINEVSNICESLAEHARIAKVDGMEDNIIEVLVANEDLISIDVEHALQDETPTQDNEAQDKNLKTAQISEAMQLISKAMDIFTDNDSDESRSSNAKIAIEAAINCYKEIYLQRKSIEVQRKGNNFFQKTRQPLNQTHMVTIVLD